MLAESVDSATVDAIRVFLGRSVSDADLLSGSFEGLVRSRIIAVNTRWHLNGQAGKIIRESLGARKKRLVDHHQRLGIPVPSFHATKPR